MDSLHPLYNQSKNSLRCREHLLGLSGNLCDEVQVAGVAQCQSPLVFITTPIIFVSIAWETPGYWSFNKRDGKNHYGRK